MTLDETADRLYALPPEEFTAARDAAAEQAKADGDTDLAKQVKALRKPSVGAWLVNLLAAQETELLDQLLALGPALAEAQAQGQGDALRELGAQRRDLVGAVVARAVELGDRTATAALREEVAATLEAALADPASAEVVRSGHLVRTLSYAGFGDVDLAGAVAVRTSAKPPAKKGDSGDAEAEAAAHAAAGRLDDLVRACEQAEREREAAQQHAEQAHAEVERLQQALRDARAAAQEADAQRKAAEAASEDAVAAVREAQRAEEAARLELDRLRRG